MKEVLKLRGKAKEDFYQSKYDNYKKFNIGSLIASCFAFIILYAADWQTYQYFEWKSLLLRVLVTVPLAVVLIAYHKTNNYKVMNTLSFLMVHAIVWGSIWVNSNLPDMSHTNENFLFMAFLLMLTSFSAPPRYAGVAQLGLLCDIILSNRIYHYEEFGMMLAYNCQVILLLGIVNYIVTELYYEQYISRKKLDFTLFHDPLTQAYNRNKLEQMMGLNHELTYISDNISILVVDIDYFKKVNDTYGHDKGDDILRFVADKIKNGLRTQDVVIRWGGEEFIVILPDCQFEQAYLCADRIRKEIATSDNGICKVTVSIGAAKYNGSDCMDTIKKADTALYQAKQEGRNKVLCYKEQFRVG